MEERGCMHIVTCACIYKNTCIHVHTCTRTCTRTGTQMHQLTNHMHFYECMYVHFESLPARMRAMSTHSHACHVHSHGTHDMARHVMTMSMSTHPHACQVHSPTRKHVYRALGVGHHTVEDVAHILAPMLCVIAAVETVGDNVAQPRDPGRVVDRLSPGRLAAEFDHLDDTCITWREDICTCSVYMSCTLQTRASTAKQLSCKDITQKTKQT